MSTTTAVVQLIPHPQQFQVAKHQQAANQDGDGDVFVELPLGGANVEPMAVLVATYGFRAYSVTSTHGWGMPDVVCGLQNRARNLRTSVSCREEGCRHPGVSSKNNFQPFVSSLERPLPSPKLKATPTGSGGLCRDEKEGEEEENKLAASSIITSSLECDLRAVITVSFSSTGRWRRMHGR